MKKKASGSRRSSDDGDIEPGSGLSALNALNRNRLKDELKRRGLPTGGNKADLVRRLHTALQKETTACLINMSESHLLKRRSDGHTNGQSPSSPSRSLDAKLKENSERENLVIWRQPIKTTYYCVCELLININDWGRSLLQRRLTLLSLVLVTAVAMVAYHIEGPHQQWFTSVEKEMLWYLYWIGLGIMSSVGFGTGLHTFLLYLGPHIASVTMAAYECGSLNFPEPPYPNEILCPDESNKGNAIVSLWTIMSKVRIEAFMWGAGTALGELPPYFMARAARLSGMTPEDDEDLQEFQELQRKKENPDELTYIDKVKVTIEGIVNRAGFLGIMLCASIPNPLFDLAGITCGHFLIPFWTFFGATLIGKAVVKMHLQKLFVIVAFNESLLERFVGLIAYVPYVGKRLEMPFREFLNEQKAKLHRSSGHAVPAEGSIVATILEKIVLLMILYFVVSLVNSTAQSYHKRIHKRTRDKTTSD